jgi:hypothetical protein
MNAPPDLRSDALVIVRAAALASWHIIAELRMFARLSSTSTTFEPGWSRGTTPTTSITFPTELLSHDCFKLGCASFPAFLALADCGSVFETVDSTHVELDEDAGAHGDHQ